MSFRSILATNQPAGLILLRVAVAGVLALEGARLLKLISEAGSSRLAEIFGVEGVWASVLGGFLLVAALALFVGFATRIAAGVSVVIAGCTAYAAQADSGLLESSRTVTDIAFAAVAGLVALYLVVHGAGLWSIDAAVGGSKRS